MLTEIADDNWGKAFEYAGEQSDWQDGSPDIRGVPGSTSDLSPFTREDVVEFVGIPREGGNDGPSWKCAGRLKDGRWFYLESGCDYTGWD